LPAQKLNFRHWTRAPRFGELETQIMECIWERGEMSAREVQDALCDRQLSLSRSSRP